MVSSTDKDMHKKRISLIVPTYNEAKNIPLLLEEIFSVVDLNRFDLEVIIVDDNSPDGTADVAEALAEKYPVRVIRRSGKLGLGSAVRAGFDASDREHLAVMDADLSHDPVILNEMFEKLSDRAITMGTRFGDESEVEDWALWRKMLSTVGVAGSKMLTPSKDPLSGYFALHRSAIEGVPLKTTGYKILFEILVKGSYDDVHEFGYTFRVRRHSTSKLNWKEYLLFLSQIVQYSWHTLWNKHRWFLLSLLGGVGLAAYAAITQSIWLDEGLSIEFARESIQATVDRSVSADLHPPLYYFLLHWLGPLFGDTVFSYRMWSILVYGVMSVILYRYLRSKRLSSSRATLLLLATWFLSPFALFYASEARSFLFAALLGLISYLQFAKIIQRNDTPTTRWWYAIVSIVGVYTYYPIIFLMMAQFLYVVLFDRGLFRKLFLPWALVTAAYAPWIVAAIFSRLSDAPGHFLPVPWWQIPAIIFVGFAGGRVAITDLHHLHDYWPSLLSAGTYALACIGLLFWWKSPRKKQSALYRHLFFFITVVLICLVISATRFSVFDPRYYSQIYPIFVLILLSSLGWLMVKRQQWFQIILGGMLVANCAVVGLYLFHPEYQREQWQEAVAEIEQAYQEGDIIVLVGHNQPPQTYREYQQLDIPIVSTFDSAIDASDMEAVSTHMNAQLANADRVWYGNFLEWQKDPEGQVRALLEPDFVYVRTIGIFKVQFDLYERR